MNKKVYVETGAFDGVCGSRSLSLANTSDYFGILVEPSPSSYLSCVNNRKNENTSVYNCALVPFSYKHDTVKMLGSTMHPGMNTCELADISNLITHTYTDEKIQIPARTLQSILDENNIVVIDDMFLDVEGSEKNVIDGIDYKKTIIKNLELELHYFRTMGVDGETQMHVDNLKKFNMSLTQTVEEGGGYKIYFTHDGIINNIEN
jgi:FkbM family methyltransferase